ncbi:hypothetical protein pb186bvf_011783 [Paramecium bursaria]
MWDFICVSIVFVILYVIYEVYTYRRDMKQAKIQQETQKQEENVPPNNPEGMDYSKLKSITLEELHKFDGVQNTKVYVAIKNIVFDVSSSPSYKPPEGSYCVFSGQDASIALGKMDLSGKYLNEYGIVKQPIDEENNMNGWFSYFYQRYPVVARVVDNKKLK